MPTRFADAFAPIAALLGVRCQIPGALTGDDGVLEAVIFDWSALTADERGELIVDFFGDAFLEAGADYVVLDASTAGEPAAPPRWRPTDLIPFALVGPAGLTERGPRWDLAGPVDAMLFLDLAGGSGDTCPIIAWFAGPTVALVEVAPSLAALGLAVS